MSEPAPNPLHKRITAEAYQERLDRISDLFRSMIATAHVQMTHRCPYKNRFDQCTAQFGCRNQRKPRAGLEAPPAEPAVPGQELRAPSARGGGLRTCGGDDKLDYRSAWDTDAAARDD